MAAPTLPEFFGANATLSGTNLTINLSDFAVTESLNGPYTATKVAAAFIRRWNNATSTKSDDKECGLVVDDPYKGLATRGGTSQREYNYSCRLYVADSSATQPDPDEIV